MSSHGPEPFAAPPGAAPDKAAHLRRQLARLDERCRHERRAGDEARDRLAALLSECVALRASREVDQEALRAIHQSRAWRTINRLKYAARWAKRLLRRPAPAPTPPPPAVPLGPPAAPAVPEGYAPPDRVGGPRVPSARTFRVVFVVRPGVYDAACMRYRGYNVIEALRRAGVEADHVDELHVPDRLADVLGYDLIVLVRRQYTPVIARLIEAADGAGVPVVCDLDDYLFDAEVVPYLEYLRNAPPEMARDELGKWREVVLRCRYYTGATPHLRERAAALGRDSFVVRNGVNQAQLALCRRELEADCPVREGVWLGYFSGTRTHQADFRIVSPTLVRLMAEFADVHLLVAGDFDLSEFPEFHRFEGRVHGRPFVFWTDLPAEIARADVNLVPLVVNTFTQGKSNLKYYEAALLKVPTVATPSRAFAGSITHGVNGFLAEDSEDWYQTLRALVTSPDLRRQIGEQAHAHAVREYTPEVVAGEALAAYRQVLTRHRERLGVPAGTRSVVVAITDLDRAVRDRVPALVMAAELTRLGAAVTIVLPGGGPRSAAEADRFLADHLTEPLFAIQVGGELPCADLLLAGDAEAAARVARVPHRGGRVAYLAPELGTVDGLPDELPVLTHDTAAGDLLTGGGRVSVTTLPAWREGAAPAGRDDLPDPGGVLVAATGDLSADVRGQLTDAVRRLHASHPYTPIMCVGGAADVGKEAGVPYKAVPWVDGPELTAAVDASPICLVVSPDLTPAWVNGLAARGCATVVATGEPRLVDPNAERSGVGVSVPADAVAMFAAVESLLVDRIRHAGLVLRATDRAARLPGPEAAARVLLGLIEPTPALALRAA